MKNRKTEVKPSEEFECAMAQRKPEDFDGHTEFYRLTPEQRSNGYARRRRSFTSSKAKRILTPEMSTRGRRNSAVMLSDAKHLCLFLFVYRHRFDPRFFASLRMTL